MSKLIYPERYSNKTVCVIDHGLFVDMCLALVPSFKKVLYWCPWESAFPKSNSMMVGKGLKGVEKIDSIWPFLEDVDLWVFPDVYQGPLQMHLIELGKRVWGARMGEDIELDRVAAKEHMRSVGIDIGNYNVLHGIDALRTYLKKHSDVFVKVSRTRGDFETFHSKNYSLSEPIVDELEHKLGAKKKVVDFVVEDAINDAVEVGYDGYTIDGEFPRLATWGIEIKDKAFVLKTQEYRTMPEQLIDVNTKLSGALKEFQYRGFISSELRMTKDGKAYAIDPCARMGSPPGELFQYMFTNMAEILWEGAEGNLVEPEFSNTWGAELLLHSQWADQNWQAVQFPEQYANNIKLRNHTVIEGKHYVVPQAVGLPEVGAVVADGATMEEAISKCKEIAEKVEGYCIQVHGDAFDEVDESISKLHQFGVEFSDLKRRAA